MYGSTLALEIGDPVLVVGKANKKKKRPLVYVKGEYLIELNMCNWEIYENSTIKITSDSYEDNLTSIREINRLLHANQIHSISINGLKIYIDFTDNVKLVASPYPEGEKNDPIMELVEGKKWITITREYIEYFRAEKW